jgi:hypothetical protein
MILGYGCALRFGHGCWNGCLDCVGLGNALVGDTGVRVAVNWGLATTSRDAAAWHHSKANTVHAAVPSARLALPVNVRAPLQP